MRKQMRGFQEGRRHHATVHECSISAHADRHAHSESSKNPCKRSSYPRYGPCVPKWHTCLNTARAQFAIFAHSCTKPPLLLGIRRIPRGGDQGGTWACDIAVCSR